MNAGVPQGSLLAPHLFNIFINDIPIPKGAKLSLFADDTALAVEVNWKNLKLAKKKVLSSLDLIVRFFDKWNIKINESKTKFIMFSKSRVMLNRTEVDQINFGNSISKWEKSVKYLGINLDQKLLFKDHINKSLTIAKSIAFSTLYCFFKKNNVVKEHQKVHLYKTVIRPILTYGCQVFNNCAKSHFNKLQIFQNKMLRLCFNINWDDFINNEKLHELANIPTIREFVNKLTSRFYDDCHSHDNNLISNLGNYDHETFMNGFKHRLPLAV
ncbi:hypothetical protein PVAND_013651 [Polypedilum vanderplanki]|uniref:Reverse transcriptase domain-containing protein n=1 Tax=Polypedilum vanderplanki TaxID=319348 RepID=A0A9J6CQC8_POLVA|nr:hypothetical protein PVAND_013651 [Polypedilum vanderplanki]